MAIQTTDERRGLSCLPAVGMAVGNAWRGTHLEEMLHLVFVGVRTPIRHTGMCVHLGAQASAP